MTAAAAHLIPGEQVDAREYFEEYPLEAIQESLLNPRTHYDAHALQELAESLTTNSQLTPALGRPVEGGASVKVDGVYWLPVELAAGHRRLRALRLAGIPTMRLFRQVMTDAEFVEALQIENLQRDNLHPMDEARGFRSLMDVVGYDIPRLAARVGRDRTYVYDRLKLLQLVPDAQTLFLAGRFELGHAIQLARLGPSDQARAIESRRGGNGRVGGLFIHEDALLTEEEEVTLEELQEKEWDDAAESLDPIARTAGLKPVSVRELKGWIDRHVRFRPEEVDLPNLFPETEGALQVAAENELKVVKITREHLVTDEAKDPNERTYGNRSWKRADGTVAEPRPLGGKSPAPATCGYGVMGVVVAGPGRGEAFIVCVSKKSCKVHWAKEMREAAQGAKEGPRSHQPDKVEDWKVFQAKEDAARKRWEKAKPAILEEVATRITAQAVPHLGTIVLSRIASGRSATVPSTLKGEGAEALLRQAAYLTLVAELWSSWDAERAWPKLLKPLGIDPKKIRDQVAPLPKAEKAQKPDLAKDLRDTQGRRTAEAKRHAAKGRRQRAAEPSSADTEWTETGWTDPIASPSAAAAKSKGVQKKATLKAKPKKKHAGDVRRAKAAKR